MSKVPGIRKNGPGHTVPADLVWDEVNPPQRYSCSSLIDEHEDGCDGTCEKETITHSEMELINEHRAWGRLGINPGMLPIDGFKMFCQVEVLIELMISAGIGTRDELNELYRKETLKRMKAAREPREEEIRRARMGLPSTGLLGPNGLPIQ